MRIEVKNLSHSFDGEHKLFDNLSFTLKCGDLTAITGPSGCGKSTLLSLLAGWVKPSSGQIDDSEIKSRSWVFQNPIGVANRTTLDHVSLPLIARGMSREEANRRSKEILNLYNLTKLSQQPFSSLSGGEAQRLMLARATAKAPDLLLVDEPTAQLDTNSAHTVNEVLQNLAQNNSIVVVATHDPDTRDACTTKIDLRDYAPQIGLT